MRVSSDGLVHLSIDELLSIPLSHLISGLDGDQGDCNAICGHGTSISGYTEWVSTSTPSITIGWDWCIRSTVWAHYWARVGTPRSNVMLVYGAGEDAGWDKNLEILSTIVDSLPWREQVPQAVASRYA